MSSAAVIKRTFAPAAQVGHVYARERGATTAPMPIGNVLELELSHKEEVQTQPDMTQLGGGVHAELRRVTEVEIKMKLADLNVTNMARATLGTVTGVEGGTVAGEVHKVTRGGMLRTAHIAPTKVVVRKGTSAGTATATDEEHLNVSKGDTIVLDNPGPATNVTIRVGDSVATATPLTAAGNYTVDAAGVHVDAAAPDVTNGKGFWISYEYPTVGAVVPAAGNWEARAAGVFVFPDAANLADDDDINIGYEYASYAVIEALTTKAKELELIFEGLNEADDGNPSIVEVWRASQGVASSIGLMADKGFASLPVSGAVLKDDTKNGAGISKYYRVRKI